MKLRSLIIIILLIAAMVALGWIQFSSSDTDANIKIDTQEMKDDTNDAIDKGKEVLKDAKESIDDAVGNDSAPPDSPN